MHVIWIAGPIPEQDECYLAEDDLSVSGVKAFEFVERFNLVIAILKKFDDRLKHLEKSILPLHTSTQTLTRLAESKGCIFCITPLANRFLRYRQHFAQYR